MTSSRMPVGPGTGSPRSQGNTGSHRCSPGRARRFVEPGDAGFAAGTWISAGVPVQEQHWDASLEGPERQATEPVHAAARLPAPTLMDQSTPTPTASPSPTRVAGDAPASAGDTRELDLDAQLVAGVLAGDRVAMADLYDRYADRINTMCVHMLGDRDEGADACAEVFLVALQRLHQLRDPAKLRSWLYAIARNEVYKRSRARSKVRPFEELDDMAALASDPTVLEAPAVDSTAELNAADPAALAQLVQSAAGGLDERDRMVLELSVAQGLDGQELADALGVTLEHSYQMTHRMRERFERSAGALLVVSAGREQCGDLDRVAQRWDGTYDVLWRKRFARHVERCDRCSRMRSRLPKALLAGVALSQAAQSAVLAAPISVRERVLEQGPSIVASETARPWSSDGFPRKRRRGRRLAQFAAGAVVAIVVLVGLGAVVDDGVSDGVGDESPVAPIPPTVAETTPEVPTTVISPGEDPSSVGEPETEPGDPPAPTDGDGSGNPDATPDEPGIPGSEGDPDGGVVTPTPQDPGEGGTQTDPGATSPGGIYDAPVYDPKNPGYDPKNPGGNQGTGQGQTDPPVFVVPPPIVWTPPSIVIPPTTTIPRLF